jgi:hypothetical protein
LKNNLDSSSYKTIWRCSQHADDFLEKAFQPLNVKSGFQQAGVYPLDPKNILSSCPQFNLLDQVKADFVFQCLTPISELCYELGFVPEDEFQRILSEEEEVDNSISCKNWKALE